jgi:uncharacterized protein YceK
MYRQHIIVLFLVTVLLTGCSSIKVVPEQSGNGRINSADSSQTMVSKGVEATVRMDETGINAYNLDSTITAFHVSIKNATDAEVALNNESYVLVDESGLQYNALTPENVRTMLNKDSYYLVPYPYVGFYYLEDFEKANAYNRFNSALPYYYNLYPQDLFTKALQETTVIPGMKAEGLTYFKIDPAAHQRITLLIFRAGASKSSPPDFSFPFNIIK